MDRVWRHQRIVAGDEGEAGTCAPTDHWPGEPDSRCNPSRAWLGPRLHPAPGPKARGPLVPCRDSSLNNCGVILSEVRPALGPNEAEGPAVVFPSNFWDA